MSKMRVGVMDSALAGRPAVDSITRANYVSAVVNRVDSFWVPDHLNALFPRSIWTPKYTGAAALTKGGRKHGAVDHAGAFWPPATGSAACASA
jgi:hypothetical protein